ncbi:MAG: hypothetical protein ACRD2Z_08595 [Thermoanaerobaculia bacterium]
MIQADLLAAVSPVVDALERLGVAYSVVGSIASSAHGIARASIDADLVADLHTPHIDPFVRLLEQDYYVEREAVLSAVERRSQFNVVHLATMLKVDLYMLTERAFDRESFDRRQPGALDPEAARLYRIATAEDTALHKLEWYRDGGEVSDRQWSDVVGILKVQDDDLDLKYMRRVAATLGIEDLLARALEDARA